MTHAYSKSYLDSSKPNLACFFDCGINDLNLSPKWISELFVTTGYADLFEIGTPWIVTGMSGLELAQRVVEKAYGKPVKVNNFTHDGYTPEYWAGWALADYQWYSGRRFKDIFESVPFETIISMYPTYHEMDITSFYSAMDSLLSENVLDTKLKRIRENRGVSQLELAQMSGVNIRNIRAYEQRSNDIDKAQGSTLCKLSRVLGCKIEDILENPMA